MAGKSGPKRTKLEHERDLAILSELYVKGMTEWDMTQVISDQYADFDISINMIRKDKAEIRQRWIDSQIINFDAAKSRELELIDKTIAACWVGWENSLRDEGHVVTEDSEADQLPGGQVDVPIKMKSFKKIERKAARDGSIIWLEQIRKLSDQRAKILGLYEVEKIQIDVRERLLQSGMTNQAIEKTLEDALTVAEKAFSEHE